MNKLVKTSYSEDDVTVLLKDLTDKMKEMSTEEREKAIQSGVHYSEMLPEEKAPSAEYEKLYTKALEDKKHDIAIGIARISEMMLIKSGYTLDDKTKCSINNKKPIVVSLARAGIPVGILIKRYLKEQHGIDCAHYAISIIRDKGIDNNAMEYIYNKEVIENHNIVQNMFFVDGWTGKGMIKMQLDEAVQELKGLDSKWNELNNDLFVLADPANITKFCGTRADFLLPSACLNSTVSGLTSRTILNKLIDISNGDFHGAVYFKKFETIDKSNEFINIISNEFKHLDCISIEPLDIDTGWNGMSITTDICNLFDVKDFKKVKPGIGETTRVLLRRIPWKVLINKDISDDDPDIQHILLLCEEKKVPVMRWDLGHYKVCGIIKELSADA
jgi:hypothetical protein